MCRVCNEAFPTASDYRTLRNAAVCLRQRTTAAGFNADNPEFVAAIAALDRMRFAASPSESSPEWGQPETAAFTERLLFKSEPATALTLFVLTCWYNAQEHYTSVWTRRLEELSSWTAKIGGTEDTLPRATSGDWTRAVAWKTWARCRDGGFGRYFVESVAAIVAKNPGGQGNTWTFVARLADDLTKPGPETRDALRNLRPGSYRPALYKRAWMMTMFLRRDQGIVRCLLERALSSLPGGPDAVRAWYDDRVFPSAESELPVDKRMLTIGGELFGTGTATMEVVMIQAHQWGQRHQLPPSTLDALFYAMD